MTTVVGYSFDAAIVMGRWQIVHLGHDRLFEKAQSLAPRIFVVVGSAFRARDPSNPFDWTERVEMIKRHVGPSVARRMEFIPIPDLYDIDDWADAVRRAVAERINAGTSKIALVGHHKDMSSDYLDHFADFKLMEVAALPGLNATELRDLYFSAERTAEAPWEQCIGDKISPAVMEYLKQFRINQRPIFDSRVREAEAVKATIARWGRGPHLTADAVVTCGDYVLMVQRGGLIGHGLWALPGGYVDDGEDFFDAMLRELREETGLVLSRFVAKVLLRSQMTFGHPRRSPRGRLVSQAYHLELTHGDPPSVRPAVDKDGHQEAMDVQWIHVRRLKHMASQLFEDHQHILRSLGIWPAGPNRLEHR